MNDQDRLEEIRQRRAVIAPVPWVQQNAMSNRWTVLAADGQTVVSANAARFTGDADAEFIAHAPEDIDWLLGEVEGLRESLREWRRNADTAGGRYMEAAKRITGLEAATQSAFAEVERLRGLLRDDLVNLWTDLEQAIRRAHNGQWSMECDWFMDRIKTLTQIVGPASWEQLPIILLESGLYQRTHAELGIDAPVDMNRVAEVRAIINASVDRST